MRTVHGWHRALRWVLGVFGSLLGLVALAIVAALVVFQTGWGRGILRSQIESKMNSTFVGGATIGGIEGNPFTDLVLTDVVINGPDKQPAITVPRLTVNVPLLPLISHEVRVEKLIADGLDVNLKRDASGRLEITQLTYPGPGTTWNFSLPDILVHRGHVAFDTGTEVMNFDNLEISVDAKIPFAGPLSAGANITGNWRERRAPVLVAASVRGDKEVFEVKSLAARVGGVSASIVGARIPKGAFSKPLAGTVAIVAPAAAVTQLVPTVQLPDDGVLAVTATPSGRLTYATIHAGLGTARLYGAIRADVQAKLADGYVAAGGLDLDQLTSGQLPGHGAALATFDVDGQIRGALPTAKAIVTAWGRVKDLPLTTATVALASGGNRLRATIGAVGNGIHAGVGADVVKHGKRIVLERGQIVAATQNIAAASLGKAPVRGSLDANIVASGELSPSPDLTVVGHANGKNLRMKDIGAESFTLRIDGKHLPAKPVGTARVELANVHRGDIRFSLLTVAAGNRPDGKLQVSVRSRPEPAPWQIDADALVTMGNTIVVDLQRHFVRLANRKEWHGHQGEVRISPRVLELHNFKSESGRSHVEATGSMIRSGRGAGDLTAKVDAKFDMRDFRKRRPGKIDAHLEVERQHGRFAGTLTAKGVGIGLAAFSPFKFDADAKLDARTEQLVANIDMRTLKHGSGKLALQIETPRDITSAAAWKRMPRTAIRKLELKLDDADLAKLAKIGEKGISGRVSGEIKIHETDGNGSIAIRGVKTPQMQGIGAVDADLVIKEPTLDELTASFNARLVPSPTEPTAKDITQSGKARVIAEMRFAAPDRLFDPEAWKRLGANAFRGGRVGVERIGFQPGTLERFGIVTQMRGEAGASAEIDEGMKAVRFVVNVYNLRGGLFAKPVTTSIAGILDEKSARVRANVIADNIAIVRVDGELPVSLQQLRADPKGVKTAPIRATVTLPQVPAVTVMTAIGTSQITGGTLDGKIEIAGTVARPTVDAKIVATDVTVPPEERRQVQKIEKLTIAAHWDGQAGNVAIDGNSTGGGTLKVRAQGDLDHPEALTASLAAAHLDIAPLVAFMPGPAGGLGGQLDASFALKGADPRTADLAGKLHIQNGRIPIAPTVGTLFKGDVHVDVQNHVVDLDMTGKLGRGDVKVKARAPLEGATPRSGSLRVDVSKVQLIGTTEPILTGVVTANLARVNEQWRSNLQIERMTVKVPKEKGHKLDPVGAPPDLVYGGLKIHHGLHHGKDVPAGIVHEGGPADLKPPTEVENTVSGEGPHRKTPEQPTLVAEIVIKNTFVESEEMRGIVSGKLEVSVGQDKEIGVIGNISLARAVVDLFNRRYTVDKAILNFDGSTDPVLDVRIAHDFPEVTTVTEVRGRMSKPKLVLSSTPAQYSEAELLGFLLGGEPGGDPENAQSANQRVEAAGASFVANKIGGYVKKALPIDVDVLRYEASTSTSSAAVTVGTWITDTLFLAYRRHLEARPDENAGEGEVEYWIERRLVLEGVIGDRGVNGLDLLWRRRW